jgi:hypothetical protein
MRPPRPKVLIVIGLSAVALVALALFAEGPARRLAPDEQVPERIVLHKHPKFGGQELVAWLVLATTCAMAEGPSAEKVRSALLRLRDECDVPGQSNHSLWTMYVSRTEKARLGAITELKSLGAHALPLVRDASKHATNEYQEMLTVALAAMREDDAILATATLMLDSRRPAVRVCAAMVLRGLEDERTIEQFKKALLDPYHRQDGGCIRDGDGHIYPVRLIASDALAELGVPFEEVQRMRGETRP